MAGNLNLAEFPSSAGLSRVSAVAPDISVWWCNLEVPPFELANYAQSLSDDERARAARFGRSGLRDRYIAGRGMLRLLLGGNLGIEPISVPLKRGRRGRPEIAG